MSVVATPPTPAPVSAAFAAIKISRVSKSFGAQRANDLIVLKDISFEVAAGSIIAILGASGCGKSTLLNIMSGLVAADRGDMQFYGVPAAQFTDWSTVAYMFQEDRLLPWRTALDNVGFGLEATNMPRRARRRLAAEKLALVGLEGFAEAFPHQLSGGMRSRVALARSLVGNPAILLMDEPFSKLDPTIRSQMHGEILRIHQLKLLTVVFVTHDVEEAVVLADRVVVLSPRPGRIQRIVDIALPRPRSFTSPAFGDQVRDLRVLI